MISSYQQQQQQQQQKKFIQLVYQLIVIYIFLKFTILILQYAFYFYKVQGFRAMF